MTGTVQRSSPKVNSETSQKGHLRNYDFCTDSTTIDDFGGGKEEALANLLYKDALKSVQIPMDIFPKGVSVDPTKLPSH